MTHRHLLASLTCLLLAAASAARADDWPQWLGPQRDGVWRETGILDRFPDGGPRQRWSVPVGGGYGGPAVAAGRVFVMDRQERADRPKDPFNRNARPGIERIL